MTPDRSLTSWVSVPEDSDFPIQNLPYGVFADAAGVRCGVAIGDVVFDLARAEASGLFSDTGLEADTFASGSLNLFISQPRDVWSAVRGHVTDLLSSGNADGESFARAHDLIVEHAVRLRLPVEIGDYVDFYSSEQHARNVGRMFRPDGEPLLPNWKALPVGYHGRAGTVVPTGTPIQRPLGQTKGENGPAFGPSQKLDIELEVGFITGAGPGLGVAINVDDAEKYIFGLCLLNDWSARDIQAWEYVPLGPFLGKSFATSMSSWIVPLEALEPFRTAAVAQDPQPLAYLRSDVAAGVSIDLNVDLAAQDGTSDRIISTRFDSMYWTMAQQLAHATSNGATTRPGDLYASGTVSGATEEEFGSLLERSWNGTRPITLSNGETRTFLEDGDTITITGRCEAPGAVPIGFGECVGTVDGRR
ncbi:MAG: fumarylacetoacetase [Acidimicrobiia bacterium]